MLTTIDPATFPSDIITPNSVGTYAYSFVFLKPRFGSVSQVIRRQSITITQYKYTIIQS